MSDADALYANILANPDDETLRLVYADALQDTDDPEGVARAELIRVQCALSRFESMQCVGVSPPARVSPNSYASCGGCEPCRLRDRQRALFTEWPTWMVRDCPGEGEIELGLGWKGVRRKLPCGGATCVSCHGARDLLSERAELGDAVVLDGMGDNERPDNFPRLGNGRFGSGREVRDGDARRRQIGWWGGFVSRLVLPSYRIWTSDYPLRPMPAPFATRHVKVLLAEFPTLREIVTHFLPSQNMTGVRGLRLLTDKSALWARGGDSAHWGGAFADGATGRQVGDAMPYRYHVLPAWLFDVLPTYPGRLVSMYDRASEWAVVYESVADAVQTLGRTVCQWAKQARTGAEG